MKTQLHRQSAALFPAQTGAVFVRRTAKKRVRYFSAGLLIAGVFQWLSAVADTITLNPIADTGLFENMPNNNMGALSSVPSGTIRLGKRSRALFKFDVSQIPNNATINSVTLKVQVVMMPPGGPGSTFSVYRVLQDWGEGNGDGGAQGAPATPGEATWIDRFYPSTAWATPGGAAGTDFLAASSASTFINSLGPYTFGSTAGLVDDVQNWVQDPGLNFGWILISGSETVRETARRFATREDPLHAPVLVIDFSPPGLEIVTQPQSQTNVVGSTAVFNVVATGPPPITYQWLFNANPIQNETNNTLTLNNVQTNASGEYSVIVSNQTTSITSQPATLTVVPPPPGQPFVNITSPTNGARFPTGAPIFVAADARESNGSISQVEFFLNTNSVGVVTNPPFELLLSNIPPGFFTVTAVATDPRQISVTSSVVRITVVAPPSVILSIAPPGTNFLLGTTLTNTANVSPGVTNVQFVEDNTALTNATGPPFQLIWTPAEARLYVLTAIATDNLGQSTTSAPVVIRIHLPDVVPPRITLTRGPANFAHLTNATLDLAGSASDNIGVDHIEYQVTSGPFLQSPGLSLPAEGSSNWSATINLVPGQNAVTLRSVDFAGNLSAPLTRFYSYVLLMPLSIQINGEGTVLPDLTRHPLEVGNVYRVSARAGPGQLFVGWEGVANTNSPVLSFVMESNLTLVVNFVPNPFLAMVGNYRGLFLDTNNIAPENSGSITLSLTASGLFSGKLAMLGANYPFHGQFGTDGSSTVPVLRRSLTPSVLALNLDMTNGMGQLGGYVTNLVGSNIVSSAIFAQRNLFNAQTNPAAQGGLREFTFERGADQLQVGVGFLNVSATGAVHVEGRFPGPHLFTLNTFLFSNSDCPIYLSLSGGNELLIGFAHVDMASNEWISGELAWVKSGTNGFSTTVLLAPR